MLWLCTKLLESIIRWFVIAEQRQKPRAEPKTVHVNMVFISQLLTKNYIYVIQYDAQLTYKQRTENVLIKSTESRVRANHAE